MTTIRVNVTKKVIEKSKSCGSKKYCKNLVPGEDTYTSNCAIANAVWDIIPNITVSDNAVNFFNIKGDFLSWCKLPEEAQRFIEKFDKLQGEERLSLKPISFELKIPDSVIDNISIEEITKRLELQVEKTVELV